MYPITSAVKALFDSEQRQVLRITGNPDTRAQTIALYNGNTEVFESGAGQSVSAYSGNTEVFDSVDSDGIEIYAGGRLVYRYEQDGVYTLTITDADVVIGGFSIDRYCCNGEKLEVGTAIAGQMTLRLKNTDGRFDSVVFEGTELFAEIGIADWSQTTPDIHWIPCGYFTPDVQPRRLNTISLTCLDRMTKFDVVVDANDMSFPTTVAGLITQANTICGVSLAASIDTLPNANVSITALPGAVGDVTYRNLIQWCAGIMGTNAWMDWDGLLRFTWYDGATEYEMTTANRFSSDLYENDLTITGVAYTNDSGIEIVEGTDDYAIDLTGNALAGPIIATVLPNLLTGIDGFAYRPFTATVVSAPYLWPMDLVTFVDKNGLSHDSTLTNVAFNLNGMTTLESRGMTYAVNERAKPKGVTKEQAQLISEAMERVETDIDESLTQEDIFNRLTDNGESQGLILYNGQLYINASYINAGYLNADHIRGGTLTLGGQNNQNGTMTVLDASGNVIGSWDMDGIYVSGGAIEIITSGGSVKLGDGSYPLTVDYLGPDSSGTVQHHYHLSMNNGVLEFYESSSDYSDQYNKVEFTPDGLRLYQTDSGGADPVIILQDYANQLRTYVQHGLVELSDSVSGGVTTLRYDGIQTPSLTMKGDIDMGQSTSSSSAKRLVWKTADGTFFRMRSNNNWMQLIRQLPGGLETNAISVNSSGEFLIGNPTSFRTAIGASSGVWPVSLGGTGGTTKETVRANLDIPYTAYLTSDTWGTLFNELNKIALGGSGIFLLSSASASVLSNGKINAMLVATIFKAGTADSYSFRIMASSDTGANIYAWKITSANASGRTTGTVYRYSGTAI